MPDKAGPKAWSERVVDLIITKTCAIQHDMLPYRKSESSMRQLSKAE